MLTTEAIGMQASMGLYGRVRFVDEARVSWFTRTTGHILQASAKELVTHYIKGTRPYSISLLILDYNEMSEMLRKVGAKGRLVSTGRFHLRTNGALFSAYIDKVVEWMRTQNTDYPSWPPTLNFCRVVRNAIVHDNRINISATAPTVEWRGITLSHADYGVAVLSDELLASGDLVTLMFDLEEELIALNAPFSFDPSL